MVGKLIAEKAREAGISNVVFDRNGYLYHGRVKSLADAAREHGVVLRQSDEGHKMRSCGPR